MRPIACVTFRVETVSHVGLWRPDHPNAWQELPSDENRGLLATLAELLAQQGCQMSDITTVGAHLGPASYTRLRVAVSTAQTLAWGLSVPIFGFGARHRLPNDLPRLMTESRANVILVPIYPPLH